MMLRKTTTPPDDILVVMNQFKTENTKLLSREDIKALPFRPENIDASLIDLNR
jgi:acyl-CoA thioester hydrolase